MDQQDAQVEQVIERFAPELRAAARSVASYVPIRGLSERQAFDVIAGVLAFDQDAQRLAILPAAVISPQDDVRAALVDEWMTPWAEAVRTELFGSPEPPCAGLAEAAELIRAAYEQPQRENDDVKLLENQLMALIAEFWNGLGRLQDRGLQTHVDDFHLRDPQLLFIDADGRVVVLRVERHDLLSHLARAAEVMADATGWHEAQATAYLLTSQRQYAPHVSVGVHATLSTPQHGQPGSLTGQVGTITIRASDFGYDELRALWTQLRRQGVTEKKPLSAKHARVWQYVHARRGAMTMENIRTAWNADNPNETYSERGFWKAYARAEKKGGMRRPSSPTRKRARPDTP